MTVDDLPQGARAVVWLLEERNGSVSRQELVGDTWLQERTVDRALDELEQRGLVRRDRDDDDLRYVQVSICEENLKPQRSDP